MDELLLTLEALRRARAPEDIFGVTTGDIYDQVRDIKRKYRRLVKIVHTDVNMHNSAAAHEATILLNEWLETALTQARYGTYGRAAYNPMDAITLTSKRRAYMLTAPFCAGDLCNLYRAKYIEHGQEKRCLVKVVRDARDNAALSREAMILKTLRLEAGTASFSQYFLPRLDAFAVQDGRMTKRALVLPEVTDAFDLAGIRQRYPAGVDVRHLVWMWKRMLSAIGFAHRLGIVHGAVLPPHVMMRPADHGACLIGWMQSTTQDRASYISAPYADWYPPEVCKQRRLLPATDIYLAAKCAIYLLGGDPVAESLPATVPERLAVFIKSCLFPLPERRPQDAWDLHADFDETIVKPLFGTPKFVDFAMV